MLANSGVEACLSFVRHVFFCLLLLTELRVLHGSKSKRMVTHFRKGTFLASSLSPPKCIGFFFLFNFPPTLASCIPGTGK